MKQSRLYRQREEVRGLVAMSAMPASEKRRWRRLVGRMLPSELLLLKRNLLQQLLVDAEFATVNEIVGTKKPPKDDLGLFTMVIGKFLEKIDRLEEQTRDTTAK